MLIAFCRFAAFFSRSACSFSMAFCAANSSSSWFCSASFCSPLAVCSFSSIVAISCSFADSLSSICCCSASSCCWANCPIKSRAASAISPACWYSCCLASARCARLLLNRLPSAVFQARQARCLAVVLPTPPRQYRHH
jgi:hypothetical protein